METSVCISLYMMLYADRQVYQKEIGRESNACIIIYTFVSAYHVLLRSSSFVFVIHCSSQQEAVAQGFEREYELFGTPESYFQQLPAMLHHKRKKLASCLESVGLQPIMPEGGYFMVTDISSISEYYQELGY